MSTATRTVLFTDLAGYTAKVSRMDREGLHRILEEHEAMVRPVVERYEGKVIKNIGDAFLCVFLSATDGLRAALEIVQLTHAQGAHSIRISMTTGDVEEIDGDVFGESVNLSARINSKAPGGEIWFGAATQLCMNASEIPWESVGRFRFKGIPGEQECFRAVPTHMCFLPERVVTASVSGQLIRFKQGMKRPLLPADPVILFEGFEPGSPALISAVNSLPVLEPASLFLSTYNIANIDRQEWLESGRALVVGTSDAVDAAVRATLCQVSRSTGSDTIVLDVSSASDLELMVAGLALPLVPLSGVVASYSYDLLADGRWVNQSERSILRVDVQPGQVSLRALCPGLSAGGRVLASGETVALANGVRLHTPAGMIQFIAMDKGYAGVLIGESDMRLGVMSGQTAYLGREPTDYPGLTFPDRRGQDNIRWCTGSRAARARAGGFTLDRALAGREQAEITVNGEQLVLRPVHTKCPTYILRDGRLKRAEGPVNVSPGDYVVAGTTVVALCEPE